MPPASGGGGGGGGGTPLIGGGATGGGNIEGGASGGGAREGGASGGGASGGGARGGGASGGGASGGGVRGGGASCGGTRPIGGGAGIAAPGDASCRSTLTVSLLAEAAPMTSNADSACMRSPCSRLNSALSSSTCSRRLFLVLDVYHACFREPKRRVRLPLMRVRLRARLRLVGASSSLASGGCRAATIATCRGILWMLAVAANKKSRPMPFAPRYLCRVSDSGIVYRAHACN